MTYRPYAAIIAEAQASGTSLEVDLENQSGSSIALLQPVASDGGGRIKAIDVSSEADTFKALGLATEAIPNGDHGDVITHGRLLNVTTIYTFGDYLYVSKTGGLTNILPSAGVNGFVEGDFIVRVGLIVRNRANPAQKDIIVQIERGGQV